MKKVHLKFMILICLFMLAGLFTKSVYATEANTNNWMFPQECYFYRNLLTNAGKSVYDEVYNGIFNAAEKINITETISYDDMQIIVKCVSYDHPELIWYNQTYSLSTTVTERVSSMYPDYNNLVGRRYEALQTIDEKLAPVFEVLNTLDTDVDIVKYMHDYLINTVDYSLESAYHQSMYSAIVDKKAVCMGYSHAMQYVLCKMGIPCAILVGESKDEYHAWNLLMLDGEYYALDVTWDDPTWVDEDGNVVPNYEYYLYAYFNVTDEELDKDHQRDNPSNRLPRATGTKYNFANYYKNAEEARGTDFNKKGFVVPSLSAGSYANAVALAWPGVNNANGYVIYQYDNGEYRFVSSTSSSSCIVYELDHNTEYTFAIKAYTFDDNGDIKYSGKYRLITVVTDGDEYIYISTETESISQDTTEIHTNITTTMPEGTTRPSIFEPTTRPPVFETTTSSSVFETTTSSSVFETTTKSSIFETTTKPSIFETTKEEVSGKQDPTTKIYTTENESNAKNIKVAGVKIKKLKSKKRRLIVKWTKGKKGTTGYQVQISSGKKFIISKTYTVKGIKKVQKRSRKFVKGIKYYVRVRAYRLIGGKTYYSSWSKVKKKRIK